MCRHAAAVGPPIPLSALLTEGGHALLEQSYQPRELLVGTVCADGFGVGWYDADVRPEPARYVRPAPIWSDAELGPLASLVHSRCIVAAVRNATVPGANIDANCAPFVAGRHLFSLNGFLGDFDATWRELVTSWVAPERQRLVHGTTDAEWLFQAVLSRLDALDPEPGAPANAVRAVVQDVAAHAAATGTQAHLNMLLADGHQVVATRWSHAGAQNSLYTCLDGDRPGSAMVASEPLDDGPWTPVGPGTLLVLQGGAPAVRLRL